MPLQMSLAHMIDQIRTRRAERARVWRLAELEGLSPDRLRDIGLSRDDGGRYRPL